MSSRPDIRFISPDWPAPASVHACTVMRHGGVSRAPFATLNLARHVGDEVAAVNENRRRLRQALALPGEPCWLEQVHGHQVVYLDGRHVGQCADAAWTDRSDVVCAVLTADCLPVLLCDRAGKRVAAIHAGWRGLAAGIIEQAVSAMPVDAGQLLAWLGPAIGPEKFEVGDDVHEAFVHHDTAAGRAFKATSSGRWLADLYELARQRLRSMAVTEVFGGHWCTMSQQTDFYSFRRDGVCGRMATLTWLE